MTDYKTRQIEDAKNSLSHNETANKIVLLLNGNSFKDNTSILRWVESILKDNSISNLTEKELESKLAKHKKDLEEEYNITI